MCVQVWVREGQRDMETEFKAGSLLEEPAAGLKLRNREIMTWAQVSHLTDWATQAPLKLSVLIFMPSSQVLYELINVDFFFFWETKEIPIT